jgi:hypothetical protein
MSATPSATALRTTEVRLPFIRTLLTWMLSFLAIPVAGYLGSFLVGRVEDVPSALLGGVVVGAVVGFVQALASRRRLRILPWTVATAAGASAGVGLGTLVIGYRTSLADLMLGGLITGAVIGAAQALALPRTTRLRWLWIPATTVFWALGWTVTTLAGITVDEQFIVFGASGAALYTLLAGLVLSGLRLPTIAAARGTR